MSEVDVLRVLLSFTSTGLVCCGIAAWANALGRRDERQLMHDAERWRQRIARRRIAKRTRRRYHWHAPSRRPLRGLRYANVSRDT